MKTRLSDEPMASPGRSRLDEIVEEAMWNTAAEHIHFMPAGEAALHVVAERAFRHGVEMSNLSILPWALKVDKIQPAPAEEKHFDSGLDYKGIPWKWDNRRVGQRRKGMETRATLGAVDPTLGIFKRPSMVYETTWLLDRRGGEDRRKG